MLILIAIFWLLVFIFLVWHFRNTRDITLLRWGVYDAWWAALNAAPPKDRELSYHESQGTYGLGVLAGFASIVVPLLAAIIASIYFAL
jgi:hypothetical protein